MPLPQITREEQRLDSLAQDLHSLVDDADLNIQHVFSNHLVLAGAGHVEKSVHDILSEYGRIHGNQAIERFVAKTVLRNNSLNCDKIKSVSDQFDPEWWRQIEQTTSSEERDSVDSLKNLRDQIAHGHHNGTGFNTVNGYLKNAKTFIQKFSLVVLRH